MQNRILLTAIFLTCFGLEMNAQNNWCGTDSYNEEMLNSMTPKEAELARKEHARIFEMAGNSQNGAPEGVIYTVPVVVHVIHDNCSGNISKEQIEDGIRILNNDFRRFNTDSNQTRALFKPFAADIEIEFKLARIDPNGKCTDGIVRINSPLTNDADNSVKSLSYWSSSKYLNVWIVNSIEGSGTGTTLGYAQFPGSGSWSTFGFVCRNSAFGSIGTATSDGRTASHEVGHCFGLFHTFQSGCGGNCSSSGDRVCDTPPTFEATYGCNTSQNTCTNDASGSASPYSTNVVDQIENYMSYDACTNMFSEGQKTVMRNSLFNFSQLTQLVSSSNLIATGTNPGFVAQTCTPVSDFCGVNVTICAGNTLQFTDRSYNGKSSSRTWTFQGGTPASSTDSIVTVTYPNAGLYDVVLTVGNSAGSNVKTKNDLVQVLSSTATYNGFRYDDYFENPIDFNNDWTIGNPSGGKAWELTTKAAYNGTRSAYVNNNINFVDAVEELFSPSINMSSISSPILTFKTAYAKKTSTSTDALRIFYSIDCGKTWNIMSVKNADVLNTSANTVSNDFVPTKEQWKDITINIPLFLKNQTNVRFKFEFVSGGGNNFYLDDLSIQNVTGIETFERIKIELYPNPTSGVLNLNFGDDDVLVQQIAIKDMTGKVMRDEYLNRTFNKGELVTLDVSEFAPGIYFINLYGQNGILTAKKFIVH